MAEFPDPNSGGLNPYADGLSPLATQNPRSPRCRTRAQVLATLLLFCVVFVGMAVGGAFAVRSALRPGRAWDDRLYTLAIAATLFAPLSIVGWPFLRRKWKLGRWGVTKEEGRQALTQCSTSTCAAKQTPWITYIVKWASYAALAPERTPLQRVAAWLVLAIYAIALLALTALGVIFIGAGVGTLATGGLVMAGLGLVILIFPAMAVRSLIRGIRARKVGATREELDQMRAQQSAWHAREWQKPLRSKLISTVPTLAFYSLWWLRVTLHHTQHPHESWVGPAMFTPVLIYSLYSQFRKPKPATPATQS
jgi:hypothetical protein